MFLRSKEQQAAGGEAVELATMWRLSNSWYGDRLDPSFTGRTIEATQRLLDDVGLTSPFWQLEP